MARVGVVVLRAGVAVLRAGVVFPPCGGGGGGGDSGRGVPRGDVACAFVGAQC